MFRYKIDVIKTLKEHGYNTGKILSENLIGQSSMQKMRKGEIVGIKTLETICALLNCQPGDLIEYVDTKKEPEA